MNHFNQSRTTTMRATWISRLLLFSLVTCAPLAAQGDATSEPHVQKAGTENGGVALAGSGSAADSIWMVSTRHLSCPCGPSSGSENVQFFRYDPACGWQTADQAQWDQDEWFNAVTLVYVHGNRIEPGEVSGRGLAAYRALRNLPDSRPVRFVIWSWPSSKVHGPRPRRDAQTKAARTDCESYFLAKFLNGLETDTQLRLLGYSFGARIVSGALHLAGGGTLGRYQLTELKPRPANSVRVVLQAAAMNNQWWLPGGYHDQSFSQVERLLLLYNPCDPVLRRYPRLDPSCSAQALGYTGLARPVRLGQDAERLEQANVCCQIGKTHNEQAYFASETLMRRARELLLAP
jgi:hypothetical protein